MPVYGEEGWVYGWNAVDVRIDGHLQHGDVINVAPGGLIVDFHCASQRAHFVAYGLVFHCPFTKHNLKPDKQALLRRYPDGAWIWYPGRVVERLRFSSDDAQLLDMQLPEGTVRQVVPLHQLRTAPSDAVLEKLCVGQDHFVIRSCPLPGGFWSDGSQLRREIFKCGLSWLHVVCTSLLNQTVLYLQPEKDTPLTFAQVEGVYDRAKTVEESGSPPTDTGLLHVLLRQRANPADEHRKISDGARKVFPLPTELLVEIFQSLDSIGRIRCRRVCPLWNDILTTEANFPDVRVSGGHPDYGVLTFDLPGIYWAAVGLQKCLSSHTKMVIISSLHDFKCVELAPLIDILVTSSRIPMLVFYCCHFGDEHDDIRGIMYTSACIFVECSAVDRVVWKKCDMCDRHLKAEIQHYTFNTTPGDALDGELWDVFEKHLVLTKPLDRPALATSIADCIAHRSSELTGEQIVKALNYYQRVDPRLSTPYRGRKWTTATLADLDASKLTTLTASAVSEGIVIQDTWDTSSDDSD
ncbi:uncharacterized protein LOC129596584 [Paramacrobiotus metropolitanus]|uniref:uncharacterized protein LOC129596584 n=1 Tax=Paramacrobiotus metropolitanus TaxID=2943436 RepID=UPI0024456714|nr:uncharacterized protein LOC129596584 [Paramacrobiotus metropolitanus]